MEAYTHYGKQADVFKHLVLCEILKNEKPSIYVETNSACAMYRLEHTPEQELGIYHFLRESPLCNQLANSCYYNLENEVLSNHNYYGSPALAMRLLGKTADRYYFFDIEKTSLENVSSFAEKESLENHIILRNCDSTKGVMDLLPALSKQTFIHIDPYEIDKEGIDGHTFFDLFLKASSLGMKCLLWYGFMTTDEKQRLDEYISSHLHKYAITNVLNIKLILNSIERDTIPCNPGILGSGLLASNLTEKSRLQFIELSHKLVDIYKDVKYKNHDGSLFCELQSMYLSGQPYQKSTFICRK